MVSRGNGSFCHTHTVLTVIVFAPLQLLNIFNALAGIVKLSNLEFKGDEDGCKLAGDRANFESVCKNFGVDPPALEFALTTHVVALPGNQQVEKKYSVLEAQELADSTGKDTYGKLFNFIVEATNKKLSAKSGARTSLAMGVLDIFGFEDFERQGGFNSLEQLCINLANEQLQYFFTEHIFGQELAAYAEEGIDGADIHYEDNQPMLNLILGKRGMFDTLNEQSKLKRSTDATCLEAYHQKFEKETKLSVFHRLLHSYHP
jgi:myosin heavy subunit